MIGAAVAAASLFAVTALAWTPNTAGYEAFKDVLRANHMAQDVESAAVDGQFTVKVDGETIFTGTGTTKVKDADEGRTTVSGEFDFNLLGVERSGSFYSENDDSMYFVDRTHDLHYQVVNLDEDRANGHMYRDEAWVGGRSMNKAEEALLDYVVGDLKNQFSLTNHADGSRTIAVDVTRDEVPLPLRLLIDAASSHERNDRASENEALKEWERMKDFPFFQGLESLPMEELLPELTDDAAIERVTLQLTVSADNEPQRVQGAIVISGKDEAGVTHRVEIQGDGEVSGLNATTPDAYDAAGKSVEVIDAASFGGRR